MGETRRPEESLTKGEASTDNVSRDLRYPWPTRIGRAMYHRKVTRYRIRIVDTLVEQGLITHEEAADRKREILAEI